MISIGRTVQIKGTVVVFMEPDVIYRRR